MDENRDNILDVEDGEEGAEFVADLVTLTDEEGVDHEFELVDTLDKNGNTYVALLASPENPEEALEDDGNLIIMRIVTEDDEEILELIEDDDEFDEISDVFMDRLSDLYDFEEVDDEE